MRNNSVDIAKGIAILLVIVGHTVDVPEMVKHIIFSFHMPLFFILSGWFFKIKDAKEQIAKDVKRLLVPYIFTSVLFLFWWMSIYIITGELGGIKEKLISVIYGSGTIHESPLFGDVPPLGAIWFLLALFWCRLFYGLLCKKFDSVRCVVFAIVISIAATIVDVHVVNLPFSILPGLSAMAFFMIGNMANKFRQRLLQYEKILFAFGLICAVFAISYSHLSIAKCSYGCYPLDVLAACFGAYIVYRMARIIDATYFS